MNRSVGASGCIRTLASKVRTRVGFIVGAESGSGMVYANLKSLYMKRFKGFLQKEYALAVDLWGASMNSVKPIYKVLEDFIIQAVPNEDNR